jgi:hypothetical protein
MSLIRKSDVKNHLSTRTGDSAVPAQPLIHADPTGYSEDSSQEAVVVAVSTPAGEVAANLEKPKA